VAERLRDLMPPSSKNSALGVESSALSTGHDGPAFYRRNAGRSPAAVWAAGQRDRLGIWMIGQRSIRQKVLVRVVAD
jgi:hypothetical protein